MDLARVLPDSPIERLNEAAEHLLETVGFKVLDDATPGCCAGAGASVDRVGGVVRLPRELLREKLATVVPRHAVAGSTGRRWELGTGQP